MREGEQRFTGNSLQGNNGGLWDKGRGCHQGKLEE
jgi:hypothetical protein